MNRFSRHWLRLLSLTLIQSGIKADKNSIMFRSDVETENRPVFQWSGRKKGEVIKIQAGGRTMRMTTLSSSPKAFVVPGFLTSEECDDVIKLAKLNLEPSRLSHDTTNKQQWQHRVSSQAWVRKDPHGASIQVRKISRKISDLVEIPMHIVEAGHPLQVVRYQGNGEHYSPHLDSIELDNPMRVKKPATADYHGSDGMYQVFGAIPYASRYLTALIFLNDVDADSHGGWTCFPFSSRAKPMTVGKAYEWSRRNRAILAEETSSCSCRNHSVAVAPKKGSLLLFYNHHLGPNKRPGEIDTASMHLGCDLSGGDHVEKWILNYWVEIPPPFDVVSPVSGSSEL